MASLALNQRKGNLFFLDAFIEELEYNGERVTIGENGEMKIFIKKLKRIRSDKEFSNSLEKDILGFLESYLNGPPKK